MQRFITYCLQALFLIVVYLAIRLEISAYWNHLFTASRIEIPGNGQVISYVSNPDLNSYKMIWLVNFSLFFLAALTFVNTRMIRDQVLGTAAFWFSFVILSGVYALILIALGISGKKKYLRIAAMALFGVTLAKLFFYDITRLDTILKTILFLSRGILMLITCQNKIPHSPPSSDRSELTLCLFAEGGRSSDACQNNSVSCDGKPELARTCSLFRRAERLCVAGGEKG